MTMECEDWEEILSTINKKEDLSQDNVIEKIKKELEAYPQVYVKWRKDGFDVNHLFEVKGEGKVHVCGLLFLAAQCNCEKILNLLIKNGANIENFQETEGGTILHYAAQEGLMEMVQLLIEEGADPSSKNNAGKTSRDLAQDNNIKDFLRGAEEGPLKKLGKKTNDLPQNNTNNKDTAHLLEKAEEEQPTSMATKSTKDDTIKDPLKEAEEKQPERLNEETHSPQDDNEDTTHLLKKAEEEQPTSATTRGLAAGGVVAVLGAAIAVALFATRTVAVELMPIMIAVAIVTTAALAVGGITYMLSKPPSAKMEKVEEGKNASVHTI